LYTDEYQQKYAVHHKKLWEYMEIFCSDILFLPELLALLKSASANIIGSGRNFLVSLYDGILNFVLSMGYNLQKLGILFDFFPRKEPRFVIYLTQKQADIIKCAIMFALLALLFCVGASRFFSTCNNNGGSHVDSTEIGGRSENSPSQRKKKKKKLAEGTAGGSASEPNIDRADPNILDTSSERSPLSSLNRKNAIGANNSEDSISHEKTS